MNKVIVDVPSYQVNVTVTLHLFNVTSSGEVDSVNDVVNVTKAHMQITEGVILLWTVGGLLHGVFDLIIWHLSACARCLSGGHFEQCTCFRFYGAQLALVLAFFIAVTSMALVVKRASMEDKDEGHQPFASSGLILLRCFWCNFATFLLYLQ